MNSYSQNIVIDSLKNELKSHTENDTIKVNLLNLLAQNYSSLDFEIAEKYANKANVEAKKIGYIRGEAKSFFLYSKIHISKSELDEALVDGSQALKLYKQIDDHNGIASTYSALGVISIYKNDYDKALSYFNKGLNIAEKFNNKKRLADILNNIGNVSHMKGDFEEAIHIYKKTIAVYEELGDKKGALIPINNVAIIYTRQGKSFEALEYFNKCLVINRNLNDKASIAANTLNIASVYADRQEYDKALIYLKESLKLNKELNNSREISKCLISLGTNYQASKDYNKALSYYNEALTINKTINNTEGLVTSYDNIGCLNLKINQPKIALNNFKTCLSLSQSIENKRSICAAYINLSETYFILKDYPKALYHAIKGKKLADELLLLPKQKDVNSILSKIYEATGDYENSLNHFKIHKKLNDSIFNKENVERITQLEYEYKYKQQIDSANIRELKLTKTVLKTTKDLEKSQRNYLWAIIGVLLISILLGAIIFYQKLKNEKSKSQNISMEQKLLRSQMTPHFIFNSLSVLQGMILNKEETKSVNYLSKFSKLLRMTLENSRDKTVFLSQELEAVENYLTLQSIENEKIKFNLSVNETVNANTIKVPPMLIQPFVENAIEHAFKTQKENCSIEIKLTLVDSKLICEILDNGIGIDSSEQNQNKNKKSLATKITSERLQYISKDFKMQGSIMIEDRSKFKEQGTKVTIQIPFLKQEA